MGVNLSNMSKILPGYREKAKVLEQNLDKKHFPPGNYLFLGGFAPIFTSDISSGCKMDAQGHGGAGYALHLNTFTSDSQESDVKGGSRGEGRRPAPPWAAQRNAFMVKGPLKGPGCT